MKLTASLKMGDKVKIKDGENEFEQVVSSMQVEHVPVEKGKKGEQVGVKVDQPVGEGAVVSLVE